MYPAYTDENAVAAYLDRATTANEQAILPGIIQTVSEFISTYTSRRFTAIGATLSSAPISRYYDGQGGKIVYTDQFKTLTKLEILDSQGSTYLELTQAAEFILRPLNQDVKDTIFLRNYRFPESDASILVTADFNNVALPEGIKNVATMLAAKLITNQGENSQYKKESIEGYSYELQTRLAADDEFASVRSLLDPYSRMIL